MTLSVKIITNNRGVISQSFQIISWLVVCASLLLSELVPSVSLLIDMVVKYLLLSANTILNQLGGVLMDLCV